MRIELREPRGPASPEQIAHAETRIADWGYRIPPSYRAFLAEQDGGAPVRSYFEFQQSGRHQSDTVKWFLGVTPAPDGDIGEILSLTGERILPGMLPIAEDSLGNSVLLDGRDGRDGPVYFWDHEFESDPPDEANLSWLAPDLQTFLDELTQAPEPDVPPDPGPAPSGWRRLFGQ